MALGPTLNVLSGAFGALKGAFKYVIPTGLGLTATETLSNTDGKGGWFAKAWRGVTQTAALETSGTQAIDGLFDQISGASNAVTTFFSGTLATICDFIAYMGFEPAAGWAKSLRGFEQRTQDVINSRVQMGRANGTSGAPDTVAPTPQKDMNATTLGVSNQVLGTTLATGGALSTAALVAKSTRGTYNPLSLFSSSANKVTGPAIELADDAISVMQKAQLGDDAARIAARGGKTGLAVAAGVTAVGAYNLITGTNPIVSPAEARAPAAGAATTPSVGALAPASLSETVTVGGAAVTAAKALGFKAIPILGGVLTGYETLRDTASYALNGEYSKAGTSLVAGAGLTLGATGGVLTYGLGETFHAAVRDSAVGFIGNDAKIEKAPLRSLFEAVSGFDTDMATAPTPTVAAFKAAVDNSPIKMPEIIEPEQYDIMGNATGMKASNKPPVFALQ